MAIAYQIVIATCFKLFQMAEPTSPRCPATYIFTVLSSITNFLFFVESRFQVKLLHKVHVVIHHYLNQLFKRCFRRIPT